MAKRAFFETTAADEEYIRKRVDSSDAFVSPDPLGPEHLSQLENCEILSVFIHSKLDESILRPLRTLKMIATRSTGYDHIDLKHCRTAGITVCNVPVYGDNTVAEHTFALILALSR